MVKDVMKEITTEELSHFNGKEGSPAHIAHEGKVYDVTKSRLWPKGLHMNRHAAGKDLTADFSAAPHGTEVLDRYPQIGILTKGPPEELKHLPVSLQRFLQKYPMARRHPHPMIVHFPIAFLMAASLFIILTLFLQNSSFEVTSFYLLILGAISSVFAAGTGFLTWWINYALKHNVLVTRKIQFSILLFIVEVVLIFWRASKADLSNSIYFLLMILVAPIVGLIGYYGGRLVYPVEKSDVVTK
jgi:predicted heme/steroid binding protein/uncharacterized membrane protein